MPGVTCMQKGVPEEIGHPLVGLVETAGQGRVGRTACIYPSTSPTRTWTGYLATVTSFSPALTAPSSGVTEA